MSSGLEMFTPIGMVRCCICFETVLFKDCWRDAAGDLWDMCQFCGRRENERIAQAREKTIAQMKRPMTDLFDHSERTIEVDETSCPLWQCKEQGKHQHMHSDFPCCKEKKEED